MLSARFYAIAFILSGLSVFNNGRLSAQDWASANPAARPVAAGVGSDDNSCGNIKSGTITFNQSSALLLPSMKQQLSALAADMRAYPNCRVVVSSNGNTTKQAVQRSWEHTNAMIEYLSEVEGIDRNRAIFIYGQSGDETQATFRSANDGEEGPSSVAPPHPDMMH